MSVPERARLTRVSLAFQWHALSREEQAKYYDMARVERQTHMRLYPGWTARDNYAKHKKKARKRDCGGSGGGFREGARDAGGGGNGGNGGGSAVRSRQEFYERVYILVGHVIGIDWCGSSAERAPTPLVSNRVLS